MANKYQMWSDLMENGSFHHLLGLHITFSRLIFANLVILIFSHISHVTNGFIVNGKWFIISFVKSTLYVHAFFYILLLVL